MNVGPLSRRAKMTDAKWHTQKRELEDHLQELVRALDDAGEQEAAERFRPLGFNPESNYATASEWLLEIGFVADIVLDRFPPADPRDAAVREGKRLAHVALHTGARAG